MVSIDLKLVRHLTNYKIEDQVMAWKEFLVIALLLKIGEMLPVNEPLAAILKINLVPNN